MRLHLAGLRRNLPTNFRILRASDSNTCVRSFWRIQPVDATHFYGALEVKPLGGLFSVGSAASN
jgi:hypothetical protein